jgi:hypothetical protein
MNSGARLALATFQDGRAVVEVAYGRRRARLELDQLEDRYPGQPTEERVREELGVLANALQDWLQRPAAKVELR